MELKESVEIWKQKGHIMRYWKETVEPKPTDFLSKFLNNQNWRRLNFMLTFSNLKLMWL